ncbi:hypothetical protein F5B19DRAFT_333925 [Rostrohypoxylon terebratum]|nr:hypothetical protein F5B19DRAFT_333925 [Rostrohypoxylon terebratum]
MATKAMSNLSLNPPKSKSKKAAPVADSWEDEEVSDPEPGDITSPSPSLGNGGGGGSSKINDSGFAAPPPTPASPSYSGPGVPPWQSASTLSPTGLSPPASPADGSGSEGGPGERRRPEKTDAVARRMIASALGVRAPRPTEEQRAYDRAVREKERKRREEEREAERRRKEEEDRAKAAIWND